MQSTKCLNEQAQVRGLNSTRARFGQDGSPGPRDRRAADQTGRDSQRTGTMIVFHQTEIGGSIGQALSFVEQAEMNKMLCGSGCKRRIASLSWSTQVDC